MLKILQPGIKRNVLVIAILPACAVALLLTLIFSISQIRSFEQSLTDRGFALVRQLGPAAEYGVYSRNSDILTPLIDAVMLEPDVRTAMVRSANGNVLISTGGDIRAPRNHNLDAKTQIMSVSDARNSYIFQGPIYQTDFSDELFDELLLNTNPTKEILGWVSVELSLERIQAYQNKIWLSSALIALAVFLISALIAVRLGRSITNPVMTLKTAVENIERGEFDLHVNSGASGELLSLELGVNAMARALKISREELEDRVKKATTELRNALSVLELRNSELDKTRLAAETANEAKSAFLATMSHEFRTPLNGIYGFLQLLEKTPLDETQLSFTEKIEVSTKTLLLLINDILDFSKIEISQIQFKQNVFDLNDVIDESIDACRPDAQKKNLNIRKDIDEDLPRRMVGDAHRIAQVVRNLVSNAVKFTDQGEVTISASRISSSASDQTLCISVADTGIGISSEDRKVLFQPFSQLESAMTRRHGGTGLGLAISKSLVEMMGGVIFIDSAPRIKGSSFSFTLPLTFLSTLDCTSTQTNKLTRAQDHPSQTLRNSGRPLQVLLADDNLINRQFLSTWLNQFGAFVDEVCDGNEAVCCCRTKVYDIIFMDLHMPKMDGLEASAQIRNEAGSSFKTPIIAVTADATEETKSLLIKSDLDDYLVKPVCERDLRTIMKKWCFQNNELDCHNVSSKQLPKMAEYDHDPVDRAMGIKLASGNEGLWKQSLKNLASQLPTQKKQLEHAFETGDIAKLNQLAHSIIGAASYCGATELLNASKKFKALVSQADVTSINDEFQYLVSTISRTVRWINTSNL